MSKITKILIVENNPSDIDFIRHALKKGGISCISKSVEDEAGYRHALKSFIPDVILSDYALPKFNGNTAFEIRESIAPNTPFIFVSGTIDEKKHVEYVENGVTDYVLKDKLFSLTVKVKRALKDVKERDQKDKMKEELKQNALRFRVLIEKSTDMKTLSTQDGKFLYGSPSVTKILGYKMVEFLDKSPVDFIHTNDIYGFVKKTNEISGIPGKSFFYQLRLRHKKGNWIWCEGITTNMLHEPAINALVSNFKDISERKLIEEDLLITNNSLKQTLTGLQKIMDSSLDMICSIDVEGKFVKVSSAAKSIFGFRPDELAGRKYIELVFHEDIEITNTAAVGVMNGKSVTGFENRYLHKDGNIVPILWSATWDDHDKLMYCIAKDVTESKNAEHIRERITADIIQRNKDLEQFSYIVSHNLRGPVANIIGLSETVQNENLESGLKKEIMLGLSNSAKKLDEVIIDLNDILQTRQEANQKKEMISFSKLVKDIHTSIANLIEKVDGILISDFREIDEMLTLKSYLHSIFYNLISNSLKYCMTDIAPIIEIKSQRLQNKIILQFKDNGMGIDLKKKGEQVFGLYKRFHPVSAEGKGMGLYLVKTQVEAIGGKISIESEVNKGTIFTIEFEL